MYINILFKFLIIMFQISNQVKIPNEKLKQYNFSLSWQSVEGIEKKRIIPVFIITLQYEWIIFFRISDMKHSYTCTLFPFK